MKRATSFAAAVTMLVAPLVEAQTSQAVPSHSQTWIVAKAPPRPPDRADQDKIEETTRERVAVQSALKKYQDAYDLKDMNELRKIWPRMTKHQRNSLQRTFDKTEAIQLEIVPSVIQIAGDTTTVTGQQWIRYNYEGDPGPPLQNLMRIELAKNGKGEWLLTSVSAENP